MATQSLMKYIYFALLLLAIDAAISLALVSSMVAFLHTKGRGPFAITFIINGPLVHLAGEPANLMVNQGHVTNGAGGTALVLVGFGGLIALWLENRSRKTQGKSSPIFYLWVLIVVLSWLLTLSALIYVFKVTATTAGQSISLVLATDYQAPAKYPQDDWTPETWFSAVLNRPLVSQSDRDVIAHNLRLMRGWRLNIIPLFILGFVLMTLVIVEMVRMRKSRGTYGGAAAEGLVGNKGRW
ncbi:hypothetical protein B0T17DRAFT_502515 [Bombardia bombarda]|uniref:Uncharacterized protein n=1 Tax=Bombardia bombarda TaxID=252184 RepID=A0AA39XJ15_9PEZI|nr:hypothetical protein B0T17DRAFT_502515 [Bombardia bombarda]